MRNKSERVFCQMDRYHEKNISAILITIVLIFSSIIIFYTDTVQADPDFDLNVNYDRCHAAWTSAISDISYCAHLYSHTDGFYPEGTGQYYSNVYSRDHSYISMLCGTLLEEPTCLNGFNSRVIANGYGTCWQPDYGDPEGTSHGSRYFPDSAALLAIAAYDYYKVTGNISLSTIYQRTNNTYNWGQTLQWWDAMSTDGIIIGSSSFMESPSGYPEWMSDFDYDGGGFSLNVLWWKMYRNQAEIAQLLGYSQNVIDTWNTRASTLASNIESCFWNATSEQYDYYFIYANNTRLAKQEAVGNALALAWNFGSHLNSVRCNMINMSSSVPYLMPNLYPWYPYTSSDGWGSTNNYYHGGYIWGLQNGFYAQGLTDPDVLYTLISELVQIWDSSSDSYREFWNRDGSIATGLYKYGWTAGGLVSAIIHGVFGFEFNLNNVTFTPCVSASFGDAIYLHDIAYRNMMLNLNITGNGTSIATFEVDGVDKGSNHSVYYTLTGTHYIDITMGDEPEDPELTDTPMFVSINNEANNSVVQEKNRCFNWTKVNDTVYYQLQVSNSSDFSTIFLDLSDINEIMYGDEYTEIGDYVEFTLPDAYNISWYGYHYYRVRAYA